MRACIALLLLVTGCTAFAQFSEPPDSMLARVVLLEKIACETDGSRPEGAGFPQATGFFLNSPNSSHTFLVTAKHALHRPDTVSTTQIHAVVGVDGRDVDLFLSDYRISPDVIRHPDDLVDLLLIGNPGGVVADKSVLVSGASRARDSIVGFNPEDIAGEEELASLQKGQPVFYIGRRPDSVNASAGRYEMPQGTLLKVPTEPIIMTDPSRHFSFKADFSLRIAGKPGASGSPVLIRRGARYRLIGIISAFGLDHDGNLATTAYCTAAYKILEALSGRRDVQVQGARPGGR